jgi:hypothetical protein
MNISRYNRLAENISEFKINSIKTFIPTPTEDDYRRGYIERYFIQKANDENSYIYEVNKKFYSDIKSNPFYINTTVKWKIVGNDEEIKDANFKSIKLASNIIKSISLYLPNYLQFRKK